jgi:hypothetical protein
MTGLRCLIGNGKDHCGREEREWRERALTGGTKEGIKQAEWPTELTIFDAFNQVNIGNM